MREREETVTGLIHPETIAGRTVWSQSGTSPDDLANKLRYGDPTRGWEGDERLAFCFNKETEDWEVWRLDHNQYHLVARRSARLPLDERLIDMLVTRDTRRRDPLADLYKHNEKIDAVKHQQSVDTMVEAGERVRFEAKRAGIT